MTSDIFENAAQVTGLRGAVIRVWPRDRFGDMKRELEPGDRIDIELFDGRHQAAEVISGNPGQQGWQVVVRGLPT